MFRLALSLGRTVRELSEELDSGELTEWMAFYRLEPWGCEVEDLRTGIGAATTANAFRGKKGRRAKPTDFMPKRKGRRPKNASELWRKISGAMGAAGAMAEER